MANETSTAIFGSWVLARSDAGSRVLTDRWVLIEGDRIVAVLPDRPRADTVLDRPGRMVLPGLLNLHNHCFSESVARTHTEDGSGERDIEQVIYEILLPLTMRGIALLSADERRAAARLGILQLLKGGATTVMEPFKNALPEMFEAAEEMGLRFYGAPYLFSTQVSTGEPSSGDAGGDADLATWNVLHDRWDGAANGRLRVAMSPHATDTCEPDLLRAASSRARDLGAPITLHVAQTKRELTFIKDRSAGRSPVEHLDWLGVLGPDVLAAHCIYVTDDDLRLMAGRRATILNCPRTFARSGITASFARFAEHGVRTLVATDGYNMDLIGELQAAAIISKTHSGRADAATADALIGAVTDRAAAAIGREDLGVIRPGAKADLTILDMSHPHLQPFHDPLRAVTALANRADVDGLVVDGKILIEDGHFLAGDEAQIVSEGAAAIRRIWALPEARALLRT